MYKFLLDLCLILLCTKVLGLITRRFHMPQVVGALLAGLFLGPAFLNVISETTFIQNSSEVGVIVLMFCAGMETDIKELKKCGKASLIIAIIGVIVPLIGGFAVAYFYNQPGIIDSDATCSLFLQNIFIGVILTATSVSITVETLKELGKLKTHSGNAILGAAIIDDIIGIICLTIVTSFADTSVVIMVVLLKILAFFVYAAITGYLFYKFFTYWCNTGKDMQRYTIAAFVYCLIMAYTAEEFFGVADITGAFVAGLVISMTQREQLLASKFDVLSYLYLSPIFFASIGLKVSLPQMNGTIIAFALWLTLIAVITKVIGCGLGAKICGYKNYQCKRIGVGMISRGEVALIVASKGEVLGMIGSAFLGPVVLVVIITTIITPILLKLAFKDGPVPAAAEAKEHNLADRHEDIAAIRAGHK